MANRILKVSLPNATAEELGGMKHITLKALPDMTIEQLKAIVIEKMNLKLNARSDLASSSRRTVFSPDDFVLRYGLGKEADAEILHDEELVASKPPNAGGYDFFLAEKGGAERTEVRLEGWLWWQNITGKASTAWRRSYFMLYKNRLEMVTGDDEASKKGDPIEKISFGEGCLAKEDSKWSRDFSFSLEPSQGAPFIPFAAESEADMKKWVSSIIKCLKESRGVYAVWSGWMWKKSRARDLSWRKRYFVLRSDRRLRYYRSDRAAMHNAEVTLSDNSTVNSNPTSVPKAKCPTGHMFTLEPVPGVFPMYLACDSEQERNEWIRVISEQISVYLDIQRDNDQQRLDQERNKMYRQVEAERKTLRREIMLEQAELRNKMQEELQNARSQLMRLETEKQAMALANKDERERRQKEREQLLKERDEEFALLKKDAPEAVLELQQERLRLRAEVALEKERLQKEQEAQMKIVAEEKQKVIEEKEIQLQSERLALRRAEQEKAKALRDQQAKAELASKSVEELEALKEARREADIILEQQSQKLRELEKELEEDRERLAELEDEAGFDKRDILLMATTRGVTAGPDNLPNVANMLSSLCKMGPRHDPFPYHPEDQHELTAIPNPYADESDDSDGEYDSDEGTKKWHGGMRVNPGFDDALLLGSILGDQVKKAVQKDLVTPKDGISMKTQGRVMKIVPRRGKALPKTEYAYELHNNIYLPLMTSKPKLNRFTVITHVHMRMGPEKPLTQNSLWLRYASLSRVGYDNADPGKKNQDRTLEVQCFLGDPRKSCFGVFDGHGQAGHEVSQYLIEQIPEFMIQHLSSSPPAQLKQAIRDAFVECNHELYRKHEHKFDTDYSGSTGIVLYIDGKTLYSCNVGDSRAVFGCVKDGKLVAVPLSRDHKPEEQDEAARIWKAGGRVMAPPGSDVYDPNNPLAPPPALRVWLKDEDIPGLGMTRSFGDYICHTVGVSAEPEIWEKQIDDSVHFCVVASDGVWEFLSNEDVVTTIASAPSPDAACHALIDKSTRFWLEEGGYVDDISCVIIYFKPPKELIRL